MVRVEEQLLSYCDGVQWQPVQILLHYTRKELDFLPQQFIPRNASLREDVINMRHNYTCVGTRVPNTGKN